MDNENTAANVLFRGKTYPSVKDIPVEEILASIDDEAKAKAKAKAVQAQLDAMRPPHIFAR